MTRWQGGPVSPDLGHAGWWLARGLRVGAAASLHVPIAIVLVTAVPAIRPVYPLMLLPLLLAGPVASRRLPLWPTGLAAAAAAGAVSGAVAAGSLAAAHMLTGAWYWGLTAAAGAPPMPQLPRITLLPTEWLTWAQQDVLFLQPVLAAALAAGGRLLAAGGRLAVSLMRLAGQRHPPTLATDRLLPRSLGGRLRLAFGTLILLTLALGMVGFGMIEEMHVRVHRLQLQVAWQRELGEARTLLDGELDAVLTAARRWDVSVAGSGGEVVDAIYARLGSPMPWPGLSAGRDDAARLAERYRPLLDRAVAAQRAFRASGGDPARLREAVAALGMLQQAVDADTVTALADIDLSHHERLIVVMAIVGLIAALGLWTGERMLAAIGDPLVALGAHVKRVACGDFQRRLPAHGPDELRQLGQALNQMTADLARLYDAERERRALAEAIAHHERELWAAREFWTNTLVHDLKAPLGLIVGWAELLAAGRHGRLAPAQDLAVQQIRAAADALNDLVTDINESFRLQTEGPPIKRTAVAPAELLHAVVEKYRGLDRLAPDVRLAGSVPPALADGHLVGRVLHNLIGNAYKHAGGRARVVVCAEAVGGAVRFAVEDDGPGIPPCDRARVFERFAQGQSAVGGSGLGLAFCKLVVERLDGRIWAEASPLGGARIVFDLPAAASVPEREAATILTLAPRVA